ncbi:hypothetical protein [Bacillus sp. NPDC094106]|uniref:hypothetical protein n=1 Tax=Bacillus sp. NPDC094106 TaxID=3363949 RepID=UPI0037F1573E
MSGIITFFCILAGLFLAVVGVAIFTSAMQLDEGFYMFGGIMGMIIGGIMMSYPFIKHDIEWNKKIDKAIVEELHVDDSEYKIVNRDNDIYEVATKNNRYKFYFKTNGKLFKVEKIKDSESLHNSKENKEKTSVEKTDVVPEVQEAVANKLGIKKDEVIIDKEKDNRYTATTPLGVYYVQTSEGAVNVEAMVKKL